VWRSILLAVALGACAAPLQQRGVLALEGRTYFEMPKYHGQGFGTAPSVVAEPEYSLQSAREVHTLTLRPFVRWDPSDPARTHYDLRRADYVLSTGAWTLGAGVNTFSWGVLEGFHPVDILNQIDLVEEPDGSQKLGQPYLSVGLGSSHLALSLYALPYFRERTFPGERGRLRPMRVVDTDQSLYDTRLGPFSPSFAGRLTLTTGPLDLALSGFRGVSREPRFFAQLSDSKVVPRYDQVEQGSVEAQWTADALVLKAEGLVRWWLDDPRGSWALGGGLEYSLFDLGGSGADLTLVAEYLHDTEPPDQAVTVWDDDLFGGFRLAFGDESGTELRAGAITDVHGAGTFLSFEAQRRLGEHWKVTLAGRAFLVRPDRIESAFRGDEYVVGRLAYFF
jgi:hypothetical protein